MKLIIHADDFGMTKSINDAIIELCKLGTLSSTSIMANMPYSHEAKALLAIDKVSLGLHATFTQGKPISNPSKVSSLLDKEGFFLDYNAMISHHKNGNIKTNEVLFELENQYNLLREIIGNQLVFVDSHHSIHNKLSSFTKAYCQFGIKAGINAVRTRQMHYIHSNKSKTMIIEPSIMSINKFGLRKVAINYLYKRSAYKLSKVFKIPDGMLVDDRPGALQLFTDLANANEIIHYNKVLYAVAHPAVNLKEIQDSNLNQERLDEYNYLKSDIFQDFVRRNPLTNFKFI